MKRTVSVTGMSEDVSLTYDDDTGLGQSISRELERRRQPVSRIGRSRDGQGAARAADRLMGADAVANAEGDVVSRDPDHDQVAPDQPPPELQSEEEVGGNIGGIAADRLRSIVERIERLNEERAALGLDVKDVFVEAKSAGFDVKVIRSILRIRKIEPAELEQQESLLELYRRALGMI